MTRAAKLMTRALGRLAAPRSRERHGARNTAIGRDKAEHRCRTLDLAHRLLPTADVSLRAGATRPPHSPLPPQKDPPMKKIKVKSTVKAGGLRLNHNR